MKLKIQPFSPNVERPYAKPYEHLEPIVNALISAGNKPTNKSVWYLSRDGWRSDLTDPLDFALLQELFDFPETIKLVESRDKIFCQNSWIEIRGSVK